MMDFHTHNLNAPAGKAIINLPEEALRNPASFCFRPDCMYSAGIHPWWTNEKSPQADYMESLVYLTRLPQVVAIGECGFDRLRGDWSVQQQIFPLQIALAERHRLPVILHCVRAFDVLLSEHKRLKPTTPWIVHGFRGKPALAQQLLSAGLDLSFGEHYNMQSFLMTPASRRHIESDDGNLPHLD